MLWGIMDLWPDLGLNPFQKTQATGTKEIFCESLGRLIFRIQTKFIVVSYEILILILNAEVLTSIRK